MTSDNKQWYSEEAGFFGPEYLVEYEETLPHERTIAEVDFVEKVLGLEKGAPILDLPCGHGRHSVELASRGYAVTGVDLNHFFIEVAKKAANLAGLEVRLEVGDMREVAFDQEFDAVLNLFTAMGYFEDDEDDRKMFACAFRGLKPGGQFLVDFLNHDWVMRNFKTKSWREFPDGSLLLIERAHDPILGQNNDQRIRVRDGKVVQEMSTTLRMYTPAELVKMAESVGFSLKESYGDFEENQLEFSSPRTILLFEKV